MNTIEQLAEATESAFAFLPKLGTPLHERRILFPESFKGGFSLNFSGNGQAITVEYLDMQFEVRAGDIELFGSTVHPGFSGNMFSREHLAEHISTLASVAEALLVKHAGAV